MLSKKYFLAGELDFSTPLVRPARANVTDHIESQESDHRASYMSYRGLQQRRQLKTDFREILGAAQLPAAADDTSLKFKGGIGVIPVSSVTCVPSATPCATARQ